MYELFAIPQSRYTYYTYVYICTCIYGYRIESWRFIWRKLMNVSEERASTGGLDARANNFSILRRQDAPLHRVLCAQFNKIVNTRPISRLIKSLRQ